MDNILEMFPVGTEVVLDFMDDENPVASGSHGIVRSVDVVDGTIFVDWGNRSVDLIVGVDEFHIA